MEKTVSGSSEFSGRVSFRQEGLFWFIACVLLFLFLGTADLNPVEARWAEAAREMLLTGNWLLPGVNWETGADRGVLFCWICIPFVKLLGNTELAVRLPCVLAGLISLYAMRQLGRSLFDEKIALAGCYLLLSCYGFLVWSRSGTADMADMCSVLLATGWFFCTEGRRSFLSYLIFYLICFVGTLFKGCAALFVPAAVILPHLLNANRWKEHFNWRNAAAFFLALGGFLVLLYLLSGVWSATAELSLVERVCEGSVRKAAAFKKGFFQDWSVPLWELPRMLLPWTPLALAGGAAVLIKWKKLEPKVKDTLTGTGLALLLLAFAAAGGRYSFLPGVPFVLLFTAAGSNDREAPRWSTLIMKAAYYGCLVVASFALCSVIAYPLWNKIASCTPPAAWVIAPVVTGAVCWFVFFMDHRKNSILSVAVGMPHCVGSVILSGALLSGCALSVLLPFFRSEFKNEKRFFKTLHETAIQKIADFSPERVVVFRSEVPAKYLFVNELTSPVTRVARVEQAMEKFQPGTRVIFLFKNTPEIKKDFSESCSRLKIVPAQPFLQEENSRWSSQKEKDDRFVAFLVTLPGKTSQDNSSRSVPGEGEHKK